jgi:8-oxo-dGTP pyrophosphatase MutT (NUDIX family)
MTAAPPKNLTLVFLCDPPARCVLLGLKKRGFGQGKINGFGGKLEPGETCSECAARELEEESGVRVPVQDMQLRGRLCFDMCGTSGMLDKATGKLTTRLLVHIFSCILSDVTGGEVTESDEMIPEWFDYDAVPLDKMWLDDRFWLKPLLNGEDVVGAFVFEDEATIKQHKVRFLPRGEYVPETHDFELIDSPPRPTDANKENIS